MGKFADSPLLPVFTDFYLTRVSGKRSLVLLEVAGEP